MTVATRRGANALASRGAFWRLRSVRITWLVSRGVFAAALTASHVLSHKPLLPSDVAVAYFGAARHLMHGDVPYLDFLYEYPPGTLPVVALGWLVGGHTAGTFVVAWSLLIFAADGLILHQLTRLPHGLAAGYVWVFGVCLIGPTAVLRNDLIVVVAVVAAFLSTRRRDTVIGGALWMWGALVKVWPLALLALIVTLRRRERGRLVAGAACVLGLTAVWLAITGAVTAMVRDLGASQGQRPIEIESSRAAFAWIQTLITGRAQHVSHSFGSFNLAFTHVVVALATWSVLAVQVACVAVPLLVVCSAGISMTAPLLAWVITAYVSATTAVAPVLSPQYMLWLLGACCLLVGEVNQQARPTAVAVLVTCGLTQLAFPILFTQLEDSGAWAIAVLLARNAALLTVLALAAHGVRRTISSSRGSADIAKTARPTRERTR